MNQTNDRIQWFLDRIGKKVWRNKDTCNCRVCEFSYKNGIEIKDESHARYLYDVEASNEEEGVSLRYFDTKKERDAFELELKNKEQ